MEDTAGVASLERVIFKKLNEEVLRQECLKDATGTGLHVELLTLTEHNVRWFRLLSQLNLQDYVEQVLTCVLLSEHLVR